MQPVSGTLLRGVCCADVAHQPDITDAVTSGANKPRPSDCNTRSDAPAKQQRLAVVQACITPMYRRYGPGIVITITVAPHHAFVIKRIYVGDLSWHRLFLVRLDSSKILRMTCPGSQENRNRMTWGLTVACVAHEILRSRPDLRHSPLSLFNWLLQPFREFTTVFCHL